MAIISISGYKGSGKNTVAAIIQYYTSKEPYQVSLQEYIMSKWLHTSQNNNWEVKSFATKLKKICALLLDVPVENFEDQKFKESVLPEMWACWKLTFQTEHNDIEHSIWKVFSTEDEAREYMDNNYIVGGTLKHFIPTYREVLQFVGTNLFRNQFHPDVWVLSLFNDYKSTYLNNLWYNNKGVYEVTEQDEIIHKPEFPNWIIADTRFPGELKAIQERNGICTRVYREDLGSQPRDLHESETALGGYAFDWIFMNTEDIPYLENQVKEFLKYYKIPYHE